MCSTTFDGFIILLKGLSTFDYNNGGRGRGCGKWLVKQEEDVVNTKRARDKSEVRCYNC